jgi:hypothetical protein
VRERSQEKGRDYQRATKKWLARTRLFGYEVREFGDAYDPTSVATRIGGQYFDFSLKLVRDDKVERILYAECKYRDEKTGSITKEFGNFLLAVYRALNTAEKDAGSAAEFCFLSNLPPRTWREFLRSKHEFLTDLINRAASDSEVGPDSTLVNLVCTRSHILVLSEVLMREY